MSSYRLHSSNTQRIFLIQPFLRLQSKNAFWQKKNAILIIITSYREIKIENIFSLFSNKKHIPTQIFPLSFFLRALFAVYSWYLCIFHLNDHAPILALIPCTKVVRGLSSFYKLCQNGQEEISCRHRRNKKELLQNEEKWLDKEVRFARALKQSTKTAAKKARKAFSELGPGQQKHRTEEFLRNVEPDQLEAAARIEFKPSTAWRMGSTLQTSSPPMEAR